MCVYFNMDHAWICSFIIIFNIQAQLYKNDSSREISLDLHHRILKTEREREKRRVK